MPASQAPNLGLNHGWSLGESGWNTGMDANLKKLDALVQLVVLSGTTDIPASPSAGDRYIAPVSATGDWAGQDGKIARYDGSAWEFFTADTGWRVRVLDDSTGLGMYEFDGSAWAEVSDGTKVARTGDSIDDVTLVEYTETTGAGTTALSVTGGTIKTYTMAANTTFTDGLSDGQSLTLHLSGGDTYTATWPTITWVGGTPTLAANTVLEFWKIGSTLYGAAVGDY